VAQRLFLGQPGGRVRRCGVVVLALQMQVLLDLEVPDSVQTILNLTGDDPQIR